MADNNDPISNTSKPAGKAPTEKKKRKRPSKKVPTTVLQANNSGFMHLVQKLTGSAEELAAATASDPYSSPSNHQLLESSSMTTSYQSTATPDVVATYPNYSSSNYSSTTATAPYSNAPSYSMGSYLQEPYQTYQDPAPPAPANYGGSNSNYGYSGGYGGTGGYGSGGGYGGSGSRSFGEEDENSTYGYRGGSDRYNNNGSSPSSSRGVDAHQGSPNEFGNHNSSSDYYW